MIIGRRPSTKVFRPNSSNTMFERAQNVLEKNAVAQAEKYDNALKVDGPKMIFWTNRDGSIPCSCRASAASSAGSDIVDVSTVDELPTSNTVIGSKGTLSGKYRETKVSLFDPNVKKSKDLSEFFEKDRLSKETFRNAITSDNVDDFINSGEYAETDILDALDSEESGNGSLVDFNDPFNLFGDRIIDCPICLGTGMIDAWQPINGLRVVLDTSNIYNFSCEECGIDDSSKPTKIDMLPNSVIRWTLRLPYIWEEVVRLNVYNGIDIISPEYYSLTWSSPSNDTSGDLLIDDMDSLKNMEVPIIIALTSSEEFPITHVELIFMFADLMRGQVPDVPQAYEDEYADWSASLTFEVPTTSGISEGDYITESKYNRVWKINSIDKRITAGKTLFGISADVRALHRFEHMFYQLGVFRSPRYSALTSGYPD